MRLIAMDCPAVLAREHTHATLPRFVSTTNPVQSFRSAVSSVSSHHSPTPTPAQSNWLASFATLRSKRPNRPKTITLAASVSRLNPSVTTKSAESSSMAWSRPKSMSPKRGTVSPTWPSLVATHCNPSQTDRPRSYGEKIPIKLAGNGRSCESAGLPIRSTSSKYPKAASHHERECEPAQQTAICLSSTKKARSKRSKIQPAIPSASPLAITPPNAFAAPSKAAAKTSTSSSILMATDRGSSTRPSKRCSANQPSD
ncbi:hypothetical protein CA85_01300 [Allorhodopirellula solitaria]|uniref:Uncharacterized protein n=1 Tax=Allorhodopirellula solitaria TaxID=2527987 RepID=A0A5C5YIZ6_9BACT|nr:hypothetical protein CA85_01300 [Allorhodopirellula solitaria]